MEIQDSNKNTDRRIIKTQRAIRNALLAILGSRPLSDITITELCNLAEINRKTFYIYYNNPSEVFNECIEHFAEHLRSCLDEFSKEVNVLSPQLIFSLVTPLIESDQNIKKLIDSPNTSLLYERTVQMFTEVFLNELNQDSTYAKANETTKNVIASLFAGSLVTVYFQYSKDKKEDINEVTDVLSSILMNGINSLS